jgi:hypothetical protein
VPSLRTDLFASRFCSSAVPGCAWLRLLIALGEGWASIALLLIACELTGCGGSARPIPLVISTSSLADGHIGAGFSAQFTATGGTPPYTWFLTGGALPAGLSLNGAAGTIAGTPTEAANARLRTFSVTDSARRTQTASFSAKLTIFASVAVSPKHAALAATQIFSITPATNDNEGVKWSATGSNCSGNTCGSFSSSVTINGAPVFYTAPGFAGVYTIKATSVGDGSTAASVSVAVTDLPGVTTYHNDLFRDGANTQEYALSSATVTAATFGKLFSCSVDGAIYAHPLWVPNLTISSTQHNIIFVATQHDTLYAFDADSGGSPCTPIWKASLIDAAHGGLAGETSVVYSDFNGLIGDGSGEISPEIGVTGTPVIDLATKTLCAVSKSVIAPTRSFYQRLHAIDLITGNEKFAGPVTIEATFPGRGDGTAITSFDAMQENQRPGLALANGTVYIAWASHEDHPTYYGWIIGYDAASLAQTKVLNVSPNFGYGGIWMGGGAPAVDSFNNLYVATGNAVFDATGSAAPNNDYGDSLLTLSGDLNIVQYFTPSDQSNDVLGDLDFGSGGAMLIDLPASAANPVHLVAGGGKDGYLYLLDWDKMGSLGDSNAWQRINFGNPIFGTTALWNGHLYLAGLSGRLQAFALDTTTAKLGLSPSSVSSGLFPFPGARPSLSSMPDSTNGIAWALDSSQYCTPFSPGCGPAVLHAYDAGNLANELWNSTQGSGNAAGNAVKFTVPTVANGRVYLGTRGDNRGAPTKARRRQGNWMSMEFCPTDQLPRHAHRKNHYTRERYVKES